MLKLDFNLKTTQERQQFVSNLDLSRCTSDELETAANYILYGKDQSTNSSLVDDGSLQIETRYSTFSRTTQSLDQLLETPTYDENNFSPLYKKSIYKKPKPTFNRMDNLDAARELVDLWDAIDLFDETIRYYSGKLTEADLSDEYREKILAKKPTQYDLYRMRHQLVEMRRQQYTVRDHYHQTAQLHSIHPQILVTEELPWQEDSQFAIYPMGVLVGKDPRFFGFLEKDGYFGGETIRQGYTPPPTKPQFYLDFTQEEHIYNLFKYYEELEIMAENNPESTTRFILDTLEFYIGLAQLSEEQQEIVRFKQKKYSNSFIQKYINQKYKKSHTTGYMSTIFKKIICRSISEAAQLHFDTFCARFREGDFKVCNKCGKKKLRDIRNFTRKARSADGLANRCKECDKKGRE